MKRSLLLSTALAVASLNFQPVRAQQYVKDKKIAIPGEGGYDYMAIVYKPA